LNYFLISPLGEVILLRDGVNVFLFFLLTIGRRLNVWGGASGDTNTFSRHPDAAPTSLSSSYARARTSKGGYSVVLTRISLLIGMFKALHILYPDFASRWMRLPNSNPMFGGRPPIKWMTTDGGMDSRR
jgi:hypothetical protein